MPVPDTQTKPRLVRIGLLVVLLLLLNGVGNWLVGLINLEIYPRHDTLLELLLLGAAVIYILVMALPFMPGLEIGLALMMLLGGKGALMVYLCTLLALSLSYALGRTIPVGWVCGLLDWLHCERAAHLLRQLEPLPPRQRLARLYRQLPSRIAPWLVRHRYLALLLLFNLPGNALIGGGGGIGLVAGLSRLFPYPVYLLLVALAVAPVPLGFYLYG